MKPEFEKIVDYTRSSFIAKEVIRNNRPLLTQAWHYHPEIEICYTVKSEGKRYVGNNISDYQKNDLVMIGSSLPHGFTTDVNCHQIVIQFSEDFLGNGFLEKAELQLIRQLINRSKMGLQFDEKTTKKAKKIIKSILPKQGCGKLINLLKLLNLLSKAKEYHIICTKEYSLNLNLNALSRIKTVLDFIEKNYKKDISIREASQLINLTESAFYKFIKKHTNKKFTQIVNEFRVDHATKLLIQGEMTIAQICYDCGYNNLSYFNRKFKEIMDVKPSEFRNNYR